MRPESLEALLLDYALGQLSPEVAELIEGDLAQSPEAAKQAHGLASTLQLARQATTVTLEAPQRPLALERLRRARVTNRRRVVIWEWVRLAACVLIGLTLGWYCHIVRKPTKLRHRLNGSSHGRAVKPPRKHRRHMVYRQL